VDDRRAPHDGQPFDLSVRLLYGCVLGLGVAGVLALVLGEAGAYRASLVLVPGGLALVTPFVRAPSVRPDLGVLVLFAALIVYGPGYDVTLYGADATVYQAAGRHLARAGRLAFADPVLDDLPVPLQRELFPAHGSRADAPLARSLGGLVFVPGTHDVYSTFSQLPSAWLALGESIGGVRGLRWVTPLLASLALTAFFVFVRWHLGTASAWLAAALLGGALGQVFYARFPMAEAGGQFLLWSGLVAWADWLESHRRLAALVAGVAAGLLGCVRIEYAVLLPGAAMLLWASTGRLPLAPVTVVAWGLLSAFAAIFMGAIVPSHYGAAASAQMAALGRAVGGLHPWRWAALAVLIGLALLGRRRHALGLGRAAVLAGTAAWLLYYWLGVVRSEAAGRSWSWVVMSTGWPGVGLAVLGLPGLAWQLWRRPSGRLVLVLGGLVGAHFLFDPRTIPLPLWGTRRLLPVVLPLIAASIASLCVTAWRIRGLLGLAAGGLALFSMATSARGVLFVPLFEAPTAPAVEELARSLPPRAVVLIDPGLQGSLLDVPLTLVHGLSAIQLPGAAGHPARFDELLRALPPGPLVVLRPALLRSPPSCYAAAGHHEIRTVVPDGSAPRHALLAIDVYRVDDCAPGDRSSRGTAARVATEPAGRR
jgi:hypothetical protein